VEAEIYHDMIRGTISMMTSVSKQSGKEYPTPREIEEMAKSMVLKYPFLGDHVRLLFWEYFCTLQ